MEQNCNGCDKHCPVNELKCGKGRKLHGINDEGASHDRISRGEGHHSHEHGARGEDRHSHEHGARGDGRHSHKHGGNAADPRAIALIRQCGGYLHHHLDGNADTSQLLRALSPEETATLEGLLEKCLASWYKM